MSSGNSGAGQPPGAARRARLGREPAPDTEQLEAALRACVGRQSRGSANSPVGSCETFIGLSCGRLCALGLGRRISPLAGGRPKRESLVNNSNNKRRRRGDNCLVASFAPPLASLKCSEAAANRLCLCGAIKHLPFAFGQVKRSRRSIVWVAPRGGCVGEQTDCN